MKNRKNHEFVFCHKLLISFIKKSPYILGGFLITLIVLSGYEYNQHQLEVLGLSTNLVNINSSDYSFMLKGDYLVLRMFDIGLTYLSIYLISISYVGIFTYIFYIGGCIIVDSKNKNFYEIRYFISQVLFSICIFLFIIFIYFVSILPILNAEYHSRQDTQEAVYEAIINNEDRPKIVVNNNTYDVVLYPKESVICRIPINKDFFSVLEIKEAIKNNKLNSNIEKQIDYNCQVLGDKKLRNYINSKLITNKKPLIQKLGEKEYNYILNNYSYEL